MHKRPTARPTIACPWAINGVAPLPCDPLLPLLPLLLPPAAVWAPGARVMVGVDGVKTDGVAATQEETAAATSEVEVGAAALTVAFPAKLQD